MAGGFTGSDRSVLVFFVWGEGPFKISLMTYDGPMAHPTLDRESCYIRSFPLERNVLSLAGRSSSEQLTVVFESDFALHSSALQHLRWLSTLFAIGNASPIQLYTNAVLECHFLRRVKCLAYRSTRRGPAETI